MKVPLIIFNGGVMLKEKTGFITSPLKSELILLQKM